MSRSRGFFVVFALVAVVLAGGVSYFASASPDGLNRVAEDLGIAKTEKDHALDDSPFAGYGTTGVDNDVASGAVAGVAGVLVVLVLAGGLAFVVRRKKADPRGG